MKKFVGKILAGILLLLLIVPAQGGTARAAGASVSGASGNPGTTVTLVLYVNADGATGVQCNISYDSSVIDSVSVSGANGWTVLSSYPTFMSADMTGGSAPLSGNVAVATISAHISASAAPGAVGSVTASGIVCGDPNGGSIACGDASGSVTVNAPAPAQPTAPAVTTEAVKSDNADLASFTVSDATVSPEFSADVTEYDIVWEPYVTEPDYAYTLADEAATAEVEGTLPAKGETSDIRIIVTAEDGETVKTYVFHCSYSDRPLTPLEIMQIGEEEAAEKLAAGELSDIVAVLTENSYLTVKLEDQTELDFSIEGLENAAFATLSAEEQMRILKGEQAMVTVTVTTVEEDTEGLVSMLLAGAEASSYKIGTYLRLSAVIQIGDSEPVPVTELAGEILCRFRTAEEEQPTALLALGSEGNVLHAALLENESADAGTVQVTAAELADLICLTEVPVEEEASSFPYIPVILAFLGGVCLTAAGVAAGIVIRRRRKA